MDIVQEVILGLIQGLTEFIPISSSGHLVIGQYIFDGTSDHLLLEWLNIGTLLALLVYYRRRIIRIFEDVIRQKRYRLARNIVVTSLPAGIIGFLAADFIASEDFFSNISTVLIALAVVGLTMVCIDNLPQASAVGDGEELTVRRSFLIGMLQVLALVPGISRSGSTIVAGRLMGLSPEKAAEYSFLASIPIMCGVALKLFASAVDRGYLMEHLTPLLISNTVAFLSGLIAIRFLMGYLSSHSLAVFGWYRIALAATVALALLVQ